MIPMSKEVFEDNFRARVDKGLPAKTWEEYEENTRQLCIVQKRLADKRAIEKVP